MKRKGFLFLINLMLSISYLICFFVFCFYILKLNFYFDPAENETINYVTNLYKLNNISLEENLKTGLFRIYPDLYHRLLTFSSPKNLLFNSRLVSQIFVFLISGILYLWSRKFKVDKILTLSICLLPFGAFIFNAYYLIGRLDSQAIFLGLFSFYIIYNNYDFKTSFKNYIGSLSCYRFLLAGVILSLSILSKQSMLLFIVLSNIPLIHFKFNLKVYLNYFVFNATILILIILYWKIFNQNLFKESYLGLTLYSDNYNFESFKYEILSIFRYLPIHISVIFYGIYKNFRNKLFFVYTSIIFIYSIKLFLNIGSFYNDFHLISLFSIIVLFYQFHNKKKILLIFSILSLGINIFNINIFLFKKKLIQESEIVKKLIPNKNYITYREDNFLLSSGNLITSDFHGMIYFLKHHQNNYSKQVDEFFENTNKQIRFKKYDGIIDGINDELLSIFPEIKKYYVLDEVEEINPGFFKYKIKLYLPK